MYACYCTMMAEHTGQSSQLFPVTTGRNAQFLATVEVIFDRAGRFHLVDPAGLSPLEFGTLPCYSDFNDEFLTRLSALLNSSTVTFPEPKVSP